MRKARMRFSGRALGAMLVGFVLVLAACSSIDDSEQRQRRSDGDEGVAHRRARRTSPAPRSSARPTARRSRPRATRSRTRTTSARPRRCTRCSRSGDIDLYGEFSGTFLTYLGGTPTADGAEVFAAVEDELGGEGHRRGRSRDRAGRQRVLRDEEDGGQVRPRRTSRTSRPSRRSSSFGGPPECLDRPLCLGDKEQQLYGLQLQRGQEARRRAARSPTRRSTTARSTSACSSPAAASSSPTTCC